MPAPAGVRLLGGLLVAYAVLDAYEAAETIGVAKAALTKAKEAMGKYCNCEKVIP